MLLVVYTEVTDMLTTLTYISLVDLVSRQQVTGTMMTLTCTSLADVSTCSLIIHPVHTKLNNILRYSQRLVMHNGKS